MKNKLLFLVKYIGKAETAKRLGYSRNWLYQVLDGSQNGSGVFWAAVDREYKRLRKEMLS